ncbi:FtsX-like permease family protein [Streptomyces sp. JJ36]|uniref:FtsX-like permease family protein n=1 Tax=Streptomyces sp. JJ36 TaxID=2736645 RepID=UPI001F013B67|nr:FtsX-like permease family protein [Streptomyces sp. JJ36]MCF6526367.1 ABC transporter permease [Streptomyces sp. JJ36]
MNVRPTLRWAHADLRAHRGQAVFSVLTTAGVIASLLLAAALFSYATNPWERIFSQTRGAHVWVHTLAGTELGKVSRLDGVEGVSGPYPTARTTAGSRGVRAAVELRGAEERRPDVGRPQLVSGTWLDPDEPRGVVLESSLAQALWAEPGDTLTLPGGPGDGEQGGDRLTVLGVAETAELHYRAGEQPGIGWVLPGTLDGTVPSPTGQTVGLRLDEPRDTDFLVQRAVTLLGADQVTQVTKWQQARADAEDGYRLLGLVFGLFGLGALLTVALVASGAISTRVRGQLRDISVLKAIGFTPGQVVRVFLVQHLALALLAVALGTTGILALGARIPGRIGEAVAVWQELPGHLILLLGIPLGALLLIALTTTLAAWRAGRVPPVPAARAALPAVGPMSRLARRAMGLTLSSTLVLGWRGAFPRRARALTAVVRLTVPLMLITVALSVWTTMDRFQNSPGEIGLPAALSARAAPAGHGQEAGPDGGDLAAADMQRLLGDHPDVAAVHPGAEVAALVPGQTGTITLRGLGTRADPYPFTLAEGRRPTGPDEAVAGQGLLDLLQLDVGDWVRMTVEGRPQILHIVGRSIEPQEEGRVISTTLDTLRERALLPGEPGGPAGRPGAGAPGLRPDFSLIVLREGADPREVSSALAERVDGGLEISEVPNPTDGLTPARWGIAGLVAVLALIGLMELLTSIGAFVRDRSRDLLALRAIGLAPRQISGVIVASTGFVALAAAVAGTGLGVLVSDWLIDTQGRLSGIGAGIARVPPAWVLVALAAAAVLGAVAAAVLPGARVARRRLADSLSETL